LYGPMTVTQLAQRHRVLVKTASLVAIQLEKARLVERKADPLDRRRTLLTIPGGKKRVVEAGLQKRAAPLRRALTRLSGAERDGLIKGLKLLVLEMTGASRRAC